MRRERHRAARADQRAVRQHLGPVADEAPLGAGLGAVDAAEPDVGLARVAGVRGQLKPISPECRVAMLMLQRSECRRVSTSEEWR